MNDLHRPHGADTQGGRIHVHASVDHLANDLGKAARLGVRLDAALMQQLGLSVDQAVRVATDRGRSIVAWLDAPLEGDSATGVVRLDRFERQALKAHLNESVEVEKADIGPVKRIELLPA